MPRTFVFANPVLKQRAELFEIRSACLARSLNEDVKQPVDTISGQTDVSTPPGWNAALVWSSNDKPEGVARGNEAYVTAELMTDVPLLGSAAPAQSQLERLVSCSFPLRSSLRGLFV